jgi:restriction system protein
MKRYPFAALFGFVALTAISANSKSIEEAARDLINIILGVAILITLLALISAQMRGRHAKIRALRIADIDSMSGTQFEQYLQRILSSRGYSVTITGARGDLGVDLIASGRPAERIAVQVKRHTGKVSRRAVSDVGGGMQHYQCNRAMVITNSYFTPDAVTLARSNGCTLVDRSQLTQWIKQFQACSSAHVQPPSLPELVPPTPAPAESKSEGYFAKKS